MACLCSPIQAHCMGPLLASQTPMVPSAFRGPPGLRAGRGQGSGVRGRSWPRTRGQGGIPLKLQGGAAIPLLPITMHVKCLVVVHLLLIRLKPQIPKFLDP